jgi:hypothetical protein
MKRLLTLVVLGTLLSTMAGCRIGECWNYAWNSRFPPQQQQPVVVGAPCVVSEPCGNPCSTPCGAPSNTAPMLPSNTAPMITPSPVPVR